MTTKPLAMKIISLVPYCILLTLSCGSQNNHLPRPAGKYLVGVGYLSLADSSRKELFDNNLKSYRTLTVKFWYPSDIKTSYEPYIENADYIISNFQFSEDYRTLTTNSCRGVPVSKARKSYPVIIFSHGWGEHFSQNTILMEELASQGYIVFSMAHHYECKFSFYPDGRIVNLDVNSNRFRQIMQEQQNPDAIKIFQKMVLATTDDDRKTIFIETNTFLPTFMTGSSTYWAEDIEFLINQLDDINRSNNLFKGRLDPTRIGVMGMSMGGIATNEVCLMDRRIKAGISIDGALYGSLVDTMMNLPFLFLNSKRYSGYGNLFVTKSNKDCYSVTVRNSDHYNFTDYALFPARNTNQIGTIDAKIPIDIMNSLIPAFFDKYLKDELRINIKNICKKYDVEFVTK